MIFASSGRYSGSRRSAAPSSERVTIAGVSRATGPAWSLSMRERGRLLGEADEDHRREHRVPVGAAQHRRREQVAPVGRPHRAALVGERQVDERHGLAAAHVHHPQIGVGGPIVADHRPREREPLAVGRHRRRRVRRADRQRVDGAVGRARLEVAVDAAVGERPDGGVHDRAVERDRWRHLVTGRRRSARPRARGAVSATARARRGRDRSRRRRASTRTRSPRRRASTRAARRSPGPTSAAPARRPRRSARSTGWSRRSRARGSTRTRSTCRPATPRGWCRARSSAGAGAARGGDRRARRSTRAARRGGRARRR